MKNKKDDKSSFEYSYNKLESILDRLENEIDEYSLEELIEFYKDGLNYINVCRKKLNEAELIIQKINQENK